MAEEEITTIQVTKPVNEKVIQFVDYVKTYTNRNCDKNDAITLLLNNVDYKRLDKELDKIKAPFELSKKEE